ncbi:hypothetical protein C8R43DRAFT_1127235 [Mycena crocata]|nr:hypothetical protein C8R43DRAFT_1127235 [Mycena crocata]
MGRQKRERKRVPKGARKNLRLWAEGVRESILSPHLDRYTAALDAGWSEERAFLKKVCKEFHARIDWRTPDHEEPVLDDWDPAAPLPAKEILTDDEHVEKRKRVKELNARIRRWFTYRIRRLRKHRQSAGLDPTKNPFAVLLSKLSGLTAPPKARQAYQQFMHDSWDKIAPEVAKRWQEQQDLEGGKQGKSPKMGFTSAVSRELFNALSAGERQDLAATAKKEAAEAKAAYKASMERPPSQAPEDRQRCIDAVAEFVGPILRGLFEYTGLQSTLIMGGPVPKYDGALRTVSTSYGRNKAGLPVHWPQWDKKRWEGVSSFFTEYLHTAYDATDSAAAALGPGVDLSAAKYKIGDSAVAKPESDDESSSSEDEDEDDSDSDSDEEGAKRARKKRNTATGPVASASTAAGPVIYADGLTFDQYRERNIAQRRAEMAALDAEQEKDRPPKKTPPAHGSCSPGIDLITPADSYYILTILNFVFATAASHGFVIDIDPVHAVPNVVFATTGSHGFVCASPVYIHVTARFFLANTAICTGRAFVFDTSGCEFVCAFVLGTTCSHCAVGIEPVFLSTPHFVISRASAAEESIDDFPCPAGAADWFVEARAEMMKVALGPHFEGLLSAWTRVEYASRFEHSPSNLANKKRPTQVSEWIKNLRGKRGDEEKTRVMDPAQYEQQWKVWWATLQPKWRVRGADGEWVAEGTYGPDGKEWGPLYRWGVNGTLSILASLYFWGCAVVDDNALRVPWDAAVNDVVWMMEGLAIYYEMFKRKF